MSTCRILASVALSFACLIGGCTPTGADPLRDSALALEREQYPEAIRLANESLKVQPAGEKAAYALYLRGRAYEDAPAADYGRMLVNMQSARTSYVEALRHNPPKPLSTYIRAGLGKVAFYQDDFQTAMQQLWSAYHELQDPELKAAALYYFGKSQQRSGQFQQADTTFASVVSRYGRSGWANKSTESQGARAFYLQLGVYEQQASVDAATNLVRQRGLAPARFKDDKGRFVLRAGPYSSYAMAKQMRPKIADAFGDAVIVP